MNADTVTSHKVHTFVRLCARRALRMKPSSSAYGSSYRPASGSSASESLGLSLKWKGHHVGHLCANASVGNTHDSDGVRGEAQHRQVGPRPPWCCTSVQHGYNSNSTPSLLHPALPSAHLPDLPPSLPPSVRSATTSCNTMRHRNIKLANAPQRRPQNTALSGCSCSKAHHTVCQPPAWTVYTGAVWTLYHAHYLSFAVVMLLKRKPATSNCLPTCPTVLPCAGGKSQAKSQGKGYGTAN